MNNTTLEEDLQIILQEKNSKIMPENIKSGVKIFDIVGEYAGNDPIYTIPDGTKFAYSSFTSFPAVFNISLVEDGYRFFQNCEQLENIQFNDNSSTNISNFCSMFSCCTNLQIIENLYTNNAKDLTDAFNNCLLLSNVSNINVSNATSLTYTFGNCRSLISINIDGVPTQDVGLRSMFDNCCNVKTINIDSSIKASNLTDIFFNCTNLTTTPNLNTSNVKSFQNAFYNCTNLVSIPNYNFSNATTITRAFYNCINLTTIPNIKVASEGVTYFYYMFYNCNNLSSASIQNIINMCLNTNITTTTYKNLSNANTYSPFYGTNITNSRYSNRLSQLSSAGWNY